MVLGAAGLAAFEAHIPPLLRRGHVAPVIEQQEMARGQLLHALQDRAAVGDIAPGHVILDCQRIDLPPQQRMRQQPLQFAGKGQRAAFEPREI